MKTHFLMLAFILSLTHSSSALTSQVEVLGRCRKQGPETGDNTNARHYDFQVIYKNSNIDSASRVELVNGMSMWTNDADAPNGGSFFRWQAQPTVLMQRSLNSWVGRQAVVENAWGYFFLDFRFTLRITSPEGNVIWDNANLDYGFYNTHIQSLPSEAQDLRCNENTEFQVMPMTVGQ